MAVENGNRKNAVGYVRTTRKNSTGDRAIQRDLITRFISANGFRCVGIFEDPIQEEANHEELTSVYATKRKGSFSAREEMLLLVESGVVDMVIVDMKERLYRNNEEKRELEAVLNTQGVELVKVPPFMSEDNSGEKKTCIYHYFVPNTRGKGIRTANLLSDVGRMYEEVERHGNWLLCGVYIDSSAYKRSEIHKLMNRCDLDVIICKYFYHIKRKTLAFIGVVQEFAHRDVSIISTEEGILHYTPAEDIQNDNPMKVVTYNCFRSDQEKNDRCITTKIFDVFYKTIAKKWQEMSRYVDEDISDRPAFHELLNMSDDYDIVVVETFGKLGESVNEFVRLLLALQKPVYSLKEGLVCIEREGNEIQSNIIHQGIDSS